MEERITRLGDVLASSGTLPWNFALYLPLGDEWNLDTPAAVLDPNECEDEEDDPAFARARGLKYALGIQDVQGVVDNAKAQKQDIDVLGLLDALRYYYDHDAFVNFE